MHPRLTLNERVQAAARLLAGGFGKEFGLPTDDHAEPQEARRELASDAMKLVDAIEHEAQKREPPAYVPERRAPNLDVPGFTLPRFSFEESA